MRRFVFIFLLLSGISTGLMAQYWSVEYSVNLDAPACSEAIELTSSGYFCSHLPGGFPSGTFNATGSVTVTAGGSITTICCIDSYPGTCTIETNSANFIATSPVNGCNESFSDGTVAINFTRLPIDKPVLEPRSTCDPSVTASVPAASSVNFQWQVFDAVTWHNVGAPNSNKVTLTRADLVLAGLPSEFVKAWVRVVDPNCTDISSPISDEIIFHIPAPTITVTTIHPSCHDKTDGRIEIVVTPNDPVISDFKLTMYDKNVRHSDNIIGGLVGSGYTFAFTGTGENNLYPGLPLGDYYIDVVNNTSSSKYGTCFTSLVKADAFLPPPKVDVSHFDVPSINGYHIACSGGTQTVTVVPTGGAGGYKDFEWKKGLDVVSNTASILNKTVGVYNVSFADSKGCSATGSITLNEPTLLTSGIESVNYVMFNNRDISCSDKADGLLRASASGGVPGYSYQWSGGPSSTDYPNRNAGIYSVTVIDANGCTTNKSKTLLAPDAINFSINETQTITCAGTATGSLEVDPGSITNAIGTSNYMWSGGESSNSIFAKIAGSYSVTVTDDQGCTTTKSRILIDPPAYSATVIPDSDYNGSKISCNDGTDGTLRAIVLDHLGVPKVPNSYAWYRTSDLVTEIGSGPTKEDLGEGSYTLIVDYNLGCKAQNTFTLNDPDPVLPTISPTSNYNGLVIKCTGEANGSIRAARNGGTGTHTYLWNDAGSTVGADLVGIGAGTYIVTATDANGCTGFNSYTVVDTSPVTPSIVPLSNYNDFVIKCFGESNGSLRASASGGTGGVDYSYTWSTGATGSEIAALPAGIYTVTATDLNGCSGVKSMSIENPEQVLAMASVVSDYNGFDISCNGASNGRLLAVPYGGTNSFTYLWSNGSTSISPSGLTQGTYNLMITDTNGCNAVASATLYEPEPVVVSIEESSDFNGLGVRCEGSADGYIRVGAAGGTDAFAFEWVGESETSNTLSNISAGTYQVTVRDSNGCPSSLAHTITEPFLLTLSTSLKRDVKCFGASTGELEVTADGGVATYEYSLDNVSWQVSNRFSGLAAQSYTVYTRDRNLCVTPLPEIITEPSELAISFVDIEPAFCADPRGKAQANISGGVGAYRYEWKNSLEVVISNTNIISNIAAGAYTLTSHDGNDCPVLKTVAIVSTDGPQIVVQENVEAKCSYSSDGSATLEVIAGDGPFTYQWPDGQTTTMGSNLAKGTYVVEVKDRNNCVSTKEVAISAPDVLEIYEFESVTPACFGDCNGMIKVANTGGTGTVAYNWGATVGDVLTGVCKGSYTVQAMDANGCAANRVFVVGEPEPLEIKLIDRRLPKCHGGCDGMIAIEASGGNGGYQYEWNTGNELAIADGICAGSHTVSLTDARGCILEKNYSLGQPELLVVRLLANQQPDCHNGCNGKLEVDAIGGVGTYSYQWSTGATTALKENICSGDYTITVTDANACISNATYGVNNPPALIVDLGGSVTLCVGQTHVLNVGSTWSSYLWNSNTGLTSTHSSVTISKPGQYWVEVQNSLGCIAQDTFLLETSLDLLKASFIMPKEAIVGDTVVIIDISWPLPDRIEWVLPSEMSMLLDMRDVIFGKFSSPGEYSVNLNAHLGECFDVIGKNITILENTSTNSLDDLGFKEFVKEFVMYPNPTQGNFSVKVELAEISPVTLSVWSVLSGRMLKQVKFEGNESYDPDMIMESLIPGAYVLRLDHAKGKEYIRFIVH